MFLQVLFSETTDIHEESSADREVNKTFNPEAQCFRPIEAVSNGMAALSLSPQKPASPFGSAAPSASASPAPPKTPPSPAPFLPRPSQPLTFTTATFAQTKFGSTKLKTNSKRANR